MSSNIAIVVDSSSGIKPNQFPDVYVIPMVVQEIDGNQTFTYKDNVDINIDQVCDKLIQGKNVKTASSIPGDIVELLDDITTKYSQVFCFPIARTVSGSYNAWVTALAAGEYKNVKLFQQPMCTAATEWIVEDLIAARSQGVLNEEYVNRYLTSHGDKFQISALVPDVKYLHRGGRVSGFASIVATLFKVKVVVTLTSKKLEKFGSSSNFDKAIQIVSKEVFADLLAASPTHKIKRLAILTNKECDKSFPSEKYFDAVKNQFPNINYSVRFLPPVIVTHVGPNYVGVVVEVE